MPENRVLRFTVPTAIFVLYVFFAACFGKSSEDDESTRAAQVNVERILQTFGLNETTSDGGKSTSADSKLGIGVALTAGGGLLLAGGFLISSITFFSLQLVRIGDIFFNSLARKINKWMRNGDLSATLAVWCRNCVCKFVLLKSQRLCRAFKRVLSFLASLTIRNVPARCAECASWFVLLVMWMLCVPFRSFFACLAFLTVQARPSFRASIQKKLKYNAATWRKPRRRRRIYYDYVVTAFQHHDAIPEGLRTLLTRRWQSCVIRMNCFVAVLLALMASWRWGFVCLPPNGNLPFCVSIATMLVFAFSAAVDIYDIKRLTELAACLDHKSNTDKTS